MQTKYKNIILIVLISYSFIISCKKSEVVSKKVLPTKQVNKNYNDTIITNSGAYLLLPSQVEIDSLKKIMGEDNFYTTADDSNYYISEIHSRLKDKMINLKYDKINFRNENYIFDKKTNKNAWLILDYKSGSKPKIYSLVDFYMNLNEKNSTTTINSTNLNEYMNNPDYQSLSFDVNGDGEDDKIFSNKPNTGDNLIIYFSQNNEYVLKLKSTNFSQDGGNQVTEIKKNDTGFTIQTDFPQGTDNYTYFINYASDNFIVSKVTHKLSSWQNDAAKMKVCDFRPQINLNIPVDEIFSKLVEAEKKAVCVIKKNN